MGFELGPLATVATWLALVFAVAWGLHRRQAEGEWVRKVVHIGTGNVVLLAWLLGLPWTGCLAVAGLFTAIAFLSSYFPLLPFLENAGRKTRGVFYYALSIFILVGIFGWQQHLEFAVLGTLVMAWGDGLAALVGKRWGQHPYTVWSGQKSWEGSTAMAIASYCVTYGVLAIARHHFWPDHGSDVWLPLPVALLATTLEAWSPGGTDNLSVPLGAAIAGFGLSQWLMQG
ncbi:MAG: phosphatidate cytidylyltransferase [Oscillatoriales cyanobacterium SM2_1_8]|nr:phosphatidate cytidylyltransferase [Oscillatoriales cyanobacterium SM2_1_8]